MKKTFVRLYYYLLLTLAIGATPAIAVPLEPSPWSVYILNGIGGPSTQELITCNAAAGKLCKGELPDGNVPFASQSISNGAYASESYADLYTGRIGVKGESPTYQNSVAMAEFTDTLTFAGIGAGNSATIGIEIQVDGTFRDGSQVNFFYNAVSQFDQLVASVGYRGTFIGSGGELLSGDTYNTNNSNVNQFNKIGDWSQFGPSTFIGSIDIYGDSPTLALDMGFFGAGGVFDLSHTAAISLNLPQGLSFVSESGVFLSRIPGSIPEPATLALLGIGLAGLGWARRRQAKA